MSTVIKVENLSKQYRLGKIGTGSLAHDINRWWHRVRRKEDPYSKVDQDPTGGGNGLIWALRDINFEVEQGDVLGIIGKNGAGKSTLLKILSRTTLPTTGSVKVKGRIASLLEVGTGFHPELTGRENIFLNGAILGMNKQEIRSRFDQIVDFSGVERYIDTPVKRYSSGMYVRLAFAVAAHLDPEILIVDEVLAVGDAEFQKKCLGKMKSVSVGEGKTVLFVSHNLAAVESLCTKGIVLLGGSLQVQGDVSTSLKEYLKSNIIEARGKIEFEGTKVERFGLREYNILHSLELQNEEGQVTDTFQMGQRMLIVIQTDIVKVSDDFEIGIGIGNHLGAFPHYFVSTWEGFTKIGKLGMTTIEVEVPMVVLFPGQYTVNIWVSLRGAYYDDAVHNAMTFDVVEGKVNQENTYFQRFSKNSQVYVKTNWRLRT